MIQRTPVTVRLSEATIRQIEELIDIGLYSDIQDFITRAVYYRLDVMEIRQNFKIEIINEVESLFQRFLYSTEFFQNMDKMMRVSIEEVLLRILKRK